MASCKVARCVLQVSSCKTRGVFLRVARILAKIIAWTTRAHVFKSDIFLSICSQKHVGATKYFFSSVHILFTRIVVASCATGELCDIHAESCELRPESEK